MTDQLFPPDAGVRRISLVRLSGEIARSFVGIGRVAVEGEVHRPQHRPGGAVYFTLRDRAAQLAVRCPGARSRRCRAVDGERVVVTGRVVFETFRGQLLLEAEEVVPVGAGAVAAMIAASRARLDADGLLDRPRRPIPRLPAAIGVVCGADAAVRHDIEAVVAARFPGYPMVFEEVTVSGPGAADAIAGGLAALTARHEVEVIVLARGGGDAAQLLPFSDEELCRAICRAGVPVVSAVGHEADRPLCDEVADLRCGTPSMAAAAVVPNRAELVAELDRLLDAAGLAATRRFATAAQRLGAIDRAAAVATGLAVARGRLGAARDRLTLVRPDRHVAAAAERLTGLHARLEALSPKRVLERGYAVVRGADGTVVRRAAQLRVGETVGIELAEGGLGARVEEVRGG